MTFHLVKFAFFIAVAGLGGAAARADSIYLLNPDGSAALKPFRDNVTILRHKDKTLVFRSASGMEQALEFDKIARLSITADTVLSRADDAYTSGHYDEAVDLYLKAMRTNEAWKIEWMTPRLSQAAAKTGRFDAAMTVYIGYARIDPLSAIAMKPTLPQKGSKFLDEAAKQLDAALRTAASDGEKQALLSLLLDVQMQRGANEDAEATATQLTALTGESADPRVAGMIVGIRLDQAASEIGAGRFDRVAPLLDPIRDKLTEPAKQAHAMFLLAQARRGLAGDSKVKRLDAAIAFMRVVAHFQNVEEKPYVAESLLEAAKINETIGDSDSARLLYEQIAVEFAATPIAQEAGNRLADMTK
jgi:tetratricopeptide (TPR) repeat protein